jgi:hypothetical protein
MGHWEHHRNEKLPILRERVHKGPWQSKWVFDNPDHHWSKHTSGWAMCQSPFMSLKNLSLVRSKRTTHVSSPNCKLSKFLWFSDFSICLTIFKVICCHPFAPPLTIILKQPPSFKWARCQDMAVSHNVLLSRFLAEQVNITHHHCKWCCAEQEQDALSRFCLSCLLAIMAPIGFSSYCTLKLLFSRVMVLPQV